MAAGSEIEFLLFSPIHGPSFFGSATKSNKALQTNRFKKRFLKRHIDTRTTPGGIREGKFWLNKVHAYIDNKKFVCPRNAKERKLLRAAMVRHHLRTASQGKDPMFILPKTQRMLQG